MEEYDAVTGKAVAKRLEPESVWLEEPIPAENVEAYQLITGINQHTYCCRKKSLSRFMDSGDYWK